MPWEKPQKLRLSSWCFSGPPTKKLGRAGNPPNRRMPSRGALALHSSEGTRMAGGHSSLLWVALGSLVTDATGPPLGSLGSL